MDHKLALPAKSFSSGIISDLAIAKLKDVFNVPPKFQYVFKKFSIQQSSSLDEYFFHIGTEH